jgi:hypothetical protein
VLLEERWIHEHEIGTPAKVARQSVASDVSRTSRARQSRLGEVSRRKFHEQRVALDQIHVRCFRQECVRQRESADSRAEIDYRTRTGPSCRGKGGEDERVYVDPVAAGGLPERQSPPEQGIRHGLAAFVGD